MAISSAGHIESDPEALDAEFAAAMVGDAAARWQALEACRDYVRLVVRRSRWSNHAGQPATSELVQNTILDGWRGFDRFEGRSPGQLRAWLKAILVHAALNARRRRHGSSIRVRRGWSRAPTLFPELRRGG